MKDDISAVLYAKTVLPPQETWMYTQKQTKPNVRELNFIWNLNESFYKILASG